MPRPIRKNIVAEEFLKNSTEGVESTKRGLSGGRLNHEDRVGFLGGRWVDSSDHLQVSTYQEHVARWRDCRLCKLCETRKYVVIGRGHVPCDVLSIGEAPGESENLLGLPFIGPAGKLQDQIVEKALAGMPLTHTYTNLVCCIPREESGAKAGEPLPEEVIACTPRLKEFVRLCDPRLIVCVGSQARDYHDHKAAPNVLPYHKKLLWWEEDMPPLAGEEKENTILVVHVTHPAAILRTPAAHQGSSIRRSIITIRNSAESLCIES